MIASRLSSAERAAAALIARRDQLATRAWIEKYQAGDRDAPDVLLRAHHPMIVNIANRFCRQASRDWEDCLQEGRMGLLVGVARHSLGEQPTLPYLWVWTRHYISRWLQTRGQGVRLPTHLYNRRGAAQAPASIWRPVTKLFCELDEQPHFEDFRYSFEDSLIDVGPLAEDVVAEHERGGACRAIATWLLSHFPPRTVDVIFERFRSKQKTLEEVGEIHGVTRERIRQIEAQMLERSRAMLPLRREDEVFDAWLERAHRFVIGRNEADGRRAA